MAAEISTTANQWRPDTIKLLALCRRMEDLLDSPRLGGMTSWWDDVKRTRAELLEEL